MLNLFTIKISKKGGVGEELSKQMQQPRGERKVTPESLEGKGKGGEMKTSSEYTSSGSV